MVFTLLNMKHNNETCKFKFKLSPFENYCKKICIGVHMFGLTAPCSSFLVTVTFRVCDPLRPEARRPSTAHRATQHVASLTSVVVLLNPQCS